MMLIIIMEQPIRTIIQEATQPTTPWPLPAGTTTRSCPARPATAPGSSGTVGERVGAKAAISGFPIMTAMQATRCTASGTPCRRTTYARVYSYDNFGITGSFGYGAGQPAWGANVFTAVENGTLNAVAFYAASTNVSYEIKVFGQFNGTSFSNQLGSTVTGSVLHAGYYTIPLTPTIPISSGSHFGVVVKFTSPLSPYPDSRRNAPKRLRARYC